MTTCPGAPGPATADSVPGVGAGTGSVWSGGERRAEVRRLLGFGAVGVSGFVPNLAVMWLFTSLLGVHYTISAVIAHQVATSWNFALTDQLVFRGRRASRWPKRYAWFMLAGNADMIVRIPLLMVLVSVAGVNPLAGSAIVIGAMFLLRFVVTDRLIYRVPASAKA